MNSVSVNFTPANRHNGDWIERGEYALFWGLRYVDERYGEDDISGWSTVIGADLRHDVSERVAVGIAGSVRIGTNGAARSWSGGPQAVFTPFDNANLVLGYNVAGYKDRDFEDARYSRRGLFATFRLKFDQTSFAGIGRRR